MVKEKIEKTKVIFKKFEGEIVAVFPEEPGTIDPNTCMSYQHVGQHGTMDADFISKMYAAAPEEYADLKNELEKIVGYDLEVIRRNRSSFFEVRKEKLKRV